MAAKAPKNAVSDLKRVLRRQDQLGQATDRLRKNKSLGTVVFLDLVGSTGYRRRYGAEKGLEKSYVHNTLVSQEIERHGGWVVKWIGDGVLGCFSEEESGEGHAMKAVLAALDAIECVRRWSHTRTPDEQIHTKASVCSGAFHYLGIGGAANVEEESEGADQNDSGVVLDPLGTSVDLAARLNSLCGVDVVLVDHDTFMGGEVRDDKDKAIKYGDVRGVWHEKNKTIRWRSFGTGEERSSVYIPRVAAFVLENDELRLARTSQVDGSAVEPCKFEELVKGDEPTGERFIYVLEPVECNVKGFETARRAVALSPTPQKEPVQHGMHNWTGPEVEGALARAERAFRGNQEKEAVREFRAALDLDPRSFQANVRLAMLYRGQDNVAEALKYLEAARASDATCPIVWSLTGMAHLMMHLRNGDDGHKCLKEAVVCFTEGRRLAAKGFHGLLEQYCLCLLAICHSLLKAKPGESASLLKEFEYWPPKNRIVDVLIRLANVFLSIEQRQEEEKKKVEHELSTIREAAEDEGFIKVHYDSVIRGKEVAILIAKAEYLLKI